MDMVNEFALNGGDGAPPGLMRLKVAVSMGVYTGLKGTLRRITRPLPAVLPGYAALADRQPVDPWADVAPLPGLELPRIRVYRLVLAAVDAHNRRHAQAAARAGAAGAGAADAPRRPQRRAACRPRLSLPACRRPGPGRSTRPDPGHRRRRLPRLH